MLSRRRRAVPRLQWPVILAVMSLLMPAGVLAKPTSPVQAQRLVTNWLARDGRPLGTFLGQQVKEVIPFPDAAGQILFYAVYLDPQGFVIVAGDDLVEPVIAFAPEGLFDPSDKNPLGALVSRDVPQRVGTARAAEEQAREQALAFAFRGSQELARRKWEALAQEPGAPPNQSMGGLPEISDLRVIPLVQSKWGQNYAGGVYCYNYYTPRHYSAGCVATALAQIMRFHQFPGVGVGTPGFPIVIDGLGITTLTLRGGDGYGNPYDWGNMVLNPDGYTNGIQRQAIGALTYDAGVACKTNYSATGSGTNAENALAALQTTFKFSNAVLEGGSGLEVRTEHLPAILNPNLDGRFPVFLGITGADGHAVVADGYGYNAGTPYHHINLGWSGSQDAWYNLPTIDPPTATFKAIQSAIYNLFPTGAGEIISGRVVDAQGHPLSGAIITATTAAGGGSVTASTNNQGIYALTQVPASSSYTLSAAAQGGYSLAPAAVTITTGASNKYAPGNCGGVDFSESVPLGQALDNPGMIFTTGGDAAWFGQAANSVSGGSAARSGAIAPGQTSTLETTVMGPGTLTFYRKCSTGISGSIAFEYKGTGVYYGISTSGEKDWELQTFTLPAGPLKLTWTYSKSTTGGYTGADCFYVDRLVYQRTGGGSPAGAILLLDD